MHRPRAQTGIGVCGNDGAVDANWLAFWRRVRALVARLDHLDAAATGEAVPGERADTDEPKVGPDGATATVPTV